MFIQSLSLSPKHFSNIILCNTWVLRSGLSSLASLMQTVLDFPDVSISFQVSKKLIWKIPPLPVLTTPKSLPFHLQVIFASKKNLCLCSNMDAISLIRFAMNIFIYISYGAAGYCLKLNHKVPAFPSPTHAQIWDPLFTLLCSSSPVIV